MIVLMQCYKYLAQIKVIDTWLKNIYLITISTIYESIIEKKGTIIY